MSCKLFVRAGHILLLDLFDLRLHSLSSEMSRTLLPTRHCYGDHILIDNEDVRLCERVRSLEATQSNAGLRRLPEKENQM